MLDCKEGKDDALTEGMMRILRALEIRGKWHFKLKHVAGKENVLADLIARCEPNKIDAELKHRRPDFNWREQVMVRDEKGKWSDILRGDTWSDELWCQLEKLTRDLGGYR